ncbi:hypothetical protein [Streptomyces antibioticus]
MLPTTHLDEHPNPLVVPHLRHARTSRPFTAATNNAQPTDEKTKAGR